MEVIKDKVEELINRCMRTGQYAAATKLAEMYGIEIDRMDLSVLINYSRQLGLVEPFLWAAEKLEYTPTAADIDHLLEAIEKRHKREISLSETLTVIDAVRQTLSEEK